MVQLPTLVTKVVCGPKLSMQSVFSEKDEPIPPLIKIWCAAHHANLAWQSVSETVRGLYQKSWHPPGHFKGNLMLTEMANFLVNITSIMLNAGIAYLS